MCWPQGAAHGGNRKVDRLPKRDALQSGMALGVDQWAAEAVLALKEAHPQISLEVAIPYETQMIGWNIDQQEHYFSITSRCDKESMLQRAYTKGCAQRCNRYMVDSSQFVLAVWDGRQGGTSSTVKYAQQRGKTVVCINPERLQASTRC